MLNRNHLHLSNVEYFIKPGLSYKKFIRNNIVIDILSNIVIVILLFIITISIVSFLLYQPKKINNIHESKKYK